MMPQYTHTILKANYMREIIIRYKNLSSYKKNARTLTRLSESRSP